MTTATAPATPDDQDSVRDPPDQGKPRQSLPLLPLALVTIAAIAIHGYHLGADDGAVYLPAILKAIHPSLYPYGAEFIQSHSRLSQFTTLVAASARLTHLDIAAVIFSWHVVTVFGFLAGAWQLAALCFHSAHARWSALLLIASLLTIPAGGTALVLMDPYLTARSASTPLILFAVAAALAGRFRFAALWIILAALVHPLMAAFAAVGIALLALPSRWTVRLFDARLAATLPLGFSFTPATPEYRQVLAMRPFLFVTHWTWYEWLGIAAPLAFLFACSRILPRNTAPALTRLCRALTLLGIISTAVAVLFASNAHWESFLRLQPMRAFHLIYIAFFLLLGGLLGEYASKLQYRVLLALFAIIAAGMFLLQRHEYAHSSHIEWPGGDARNAWVAAFLWVRDNTPEDAVFALDPEYISLPGEDQHGFRGLARRSVLSDRVKDSGVVSLLPELAPTWAREQQAQQGWRHFRLADFQELGREYPVSWVVLQLPEPAGLECPYRSTAVAVCHVPGTQ